MFFNIYANMNGVEASSNPKTNSKSTTSSKSKSTTGTSSKDDDEEDSSASNSVGGTLGLLSILVGVISAF
ncbi:hypothetical protein EHP00_1008 [Ecytonucleospora hepatopenaei]|uniref:Uncharacterized protein n=1 Tax=Ecytonucleospora hepatopenaei TaxID=646526 RepID=A0A1W0E6B8_9MICR|nr:hypothetical protein EHP00_1008 [Ecytonucleospora hepatopenaei]